MPSSYLFYNDLRVHYLHWNLAGDGRPVILLHGLASNARIWDLVAPRLAENGLAPLAPDGRGHGLTDKPDGDYGFETFSRDLAGFIDALNLERPVLVGHSWGASLALDYAARVSFGPRAPAGLVLVDGGMFQLDDAPGADWESTRDRLTPPRLAGTPLDSFLKVIQRGQDGWKPNEETLPIILANFEISSDDTSGVETISPHLSFDHHMQIVRAMWEFKTYERFGRVRCPVLMVPARPPQPVKEQSFLQLKERGIDRARQSISKLQVVWMEDSIHDLPLQRPAELAGLISEFVGQV